MVRKISSSSELVKILKTTDKKGVLVKFSAEWCAPCKYLEHQMKNVEEKLNEKVEVVEVDVDELQSLAEDFAIFAVPTLVLIPINRVKVNSDGSVDVPINRRITGSVDGNTILKWIDEELIEEQ